SCLRTLHTSVLRQWTDSTGPETGLRAKCTSGPARPAPTLAWFINDEPLMTQSTRNQTDGSLETRTITLDTRLLPLLLQLMTQSTRNQTDGSLETRTITLDTIVLSRHVSSGRLVLKCTALLADIYKETVSMVLQSQQPCEPKHERVLFSLATSVDSSVTSVLLALVIELSLR
ncbi:uncharacterized protein LOC124374454, partial [Homalodisca vitripennis]|uniref:uncharacterized protein LOC124374454 n=1 Tax=Homalodisca vitripennis TaxID=197043 RepID=UPI001EEB87BD